MGDRIRFQAAGGEFRLASVPAGDREQRVFRARKLSRRVTDALQQAARVAFRSKLEIDIVERREPGVDPAQPLDLLGKLVGNDLQVLTIEIPRWFDVRRRDSAESLRDDLQQSLRFSRSAQRVCDAAVQRQFLRLPGHGNALYRR